MTGPAAPRSPEGATSTAGAAALADEVAAAVLAVPGVAALDAGTVGAAATYLPGRRVAGIRLPGGPGEATEVAVSVRFGAAVAEVADQVRRAVTALVTGPVDVHVTDVVTTAPEPAVPELPAPVLTDPPSQTRSQTRIATT